MSISFSYSMLILIVMKLVIEMFQDIIREKTKQVFMLTKISGHIHIWINLTCRYHDIDKLESIIYLLFFVVISWVLSTFEEVCPFNLWLCLVPVVNGSINRLPPWKLNLSCDIFGLSVIIQLNARSTGFGYHFNSNFFKGSQWALSRSVDDMRTTCRQRAYDMRMMCRWYTDDMHASGWHVDDTWTTNVIPGQLSWDFTLFMSAHCLHIIPGEIS